MTETMKQGNRESSLENMKIPLFHQFEEHTRTTETINCYFINIYNPTLYQVMHECNG